MERYCRCMGFGVINNHINTQYTRMAMMQRSSYNQWGYRIGVFFAILAISASLSAVSRNVNGMLWAYDELVRQYVIIYSMAGIIVGVLLVALYGARMAPKKNQVRRIYALIFWITASICVFLFIAADDKRVLVVVWSIPALASILVAGIGAKISSYHEWYGIWWKILPHDKIRLTIMLVASAFAYDFVLNAVGEWFEEYQAVWYVISAVAAAATSVLVVTFGAEFAANRIWNIGLRWKIICILMLIGSASVGGIIQSTEFDLFIDNGVALPYISSGLFAVTVVAGTLLSSHFSSLSPRYAASIWYGYAVFVLVGTLAALSTIEDQYPTNVDDGIGQSIMIAFMPVGMGVVSGILGAHYLAHMKRQGGTGSHIPSGT